jgi:hypothetical protein
MAPDLPVPSWRCVEILSVLNILGGEHYAIEINLELFRKENVICDMADVSVPELRWMHGAGLLSRRMCYEEMFPVWRYWVSSLGLKFMQNPNDEVPEAVCDIPSGFEICGNCQGDGQMQDGKTCLRCKGSGCLPMKGAESVRKKIAGFNSRRRVATKKR